MNFLPNFQWGTGATGRWDLEYGVSSDRNSTLL